VLKSHCFTKCAFCFERDYIAKKRKQWFSLFFVPLKHGY